ncbi:hypothetical protein HanRHA438_Chr15g0732991 [Helianthus annuus]|nr:hypothetical protein HanHA300_Chr15g0587661 [Helianthus annuus]KAJ0475120.1 hypothetical protein HanHA89_Chr15g0637481 [Helianthus annuus]KAJ0650675.1 hypothetical protein HanLR1_Chr15g0598391 [Helianthus annuus]KAJ0847158.1 hypothetical protein HanRHA438_Chr15g0732991 [Helianthus annuus]
MITIYLKFLSCSKSPSSRTLTEIVTLTLYKVGCLSLPTSCLTLQPVIRVVWDPVSKQVKMANTWKRLSSSFTSHAPYHPLTLSPPPTPLPVTLHSLSRNTPSFE